MTTLAFNQHGEEGLDVAVSRYLPTGASHPRKALDERTRRVHELTARLPAEWDSLDSRTRARMRAALTGHREHGGISAWLRAARFFVQDAFDYLFYKESAVNYAIAMREYLEVLNRLVARDVAAEFQGSDDLRREVAEGLKRVRSGQSFEI
jgi:hypothetical protein